MEKNEINKGNKILIVLVVILFIIIIGMGVYIAYDKKIIFSSSTNEVLTKNTTKRKNSDSENFKDIDLNSNDFINLYNMLENYTYMEDRTHGYYDFLDSEKTIIGFYNSDIKSSDFTKANNGAATDIVSYIVKTDVLSKSLKNIFGNDISFKAELAVGNSFSLKQEVYGAIGMVNTCGGEISNYDLNSNTYYVNMNNGCGGTTGPSAKLITRKIVSAKKSNDTIIVKEKVIYFETDFNNSNITYKVYSDKNHKNLIDTLSYSEDTVYNETINVDNYSETSTITHTYKLDKTTNQYYFTSSKIN